jgi:hypothetical protein
MVRLLTTRRAMTVFTTACSGKGVVTRQHMSVMQCVICLVSCTICARRIRTPVEHGRCSFHRPVYPSGNVTAVGIRVKWSCMCKFSMKGDRRSDTVRHVRARAIQPYAPASCFNFTLTPALLRPSLTGFGNCPF